MNSPYTKIFYIVEGEIIKLDDDLDPKKPITYTCLCTLENSSSIYLTGVKQSTLFGGIADYFQYRSRTSFDGSGGEFPKEANTDKLKASVGDRVYIAFIGGNIMKPIIIGYAQHPNSINQITDTDSPNTVWQYQGARVEINPEGEIRVIHKGAPEILFKPRSESDLLSSPSALPEGLEDGNPAVKNASKDEITLFELLKGGLFRLRDSEGQMFEMDRESKTMTITNNGMKSTGDDAGSPDDGEAIILDKGEGSIIASAQKIAEFKAGMASLRIEKDKMALSNGKGVEFFDLFDRMLDVFIQTTNLILTSNGPGSLDPGALAKFQQFKQELGQLKS